MRVFGMHVPLGYLRWAAAAVGVVVLGGLLATLAGVAGVFDDDAVADTGRAVVATVVAGTPCVGANPRETVEFTVSGERHRVVFDGCGHREKEPVAIRLPPGPVAGNLTVHAADASVGDGRGGALGWLLLVVSGVAGAGYAFLVRRGPRGVRLPRALRLT